MSSGKMFEETAGGGGELHYRKLVEIVRDRGIERLGLMTAWAWYDDPRHLLFTLSRYKFVAKMLAGRERVLEVGCSDAFATRLVAQEVGHIVAVDFDAEFIADAKERTSDRWPIELRVHDILRGPVNGRFDAAYAMDVLEHITPESENVFLSNIVASLTREATLIIGTPSLESQVYASPQSKEGHINCKTGPDLHAMLTRYFTNVMMFSMNDEVVHTGYHKMSHYLMALCCGPLPESI
jgi:2-polyprenyl-3-methyl-5-hydroxy-6-metoxy-1,4-benzoquinol methylase